MAKVDWTKFEEYALQQEEWNNDPAWQKEVAARDRAQKRDRKALHLRVIEKLGGRCACCGEGWTEFLCIDHVKGDGAAHRRRFGQNQYKTYRDIEKQGYPRDKFQVLCYNCNMAKRTGLYCPHQYLPSDKDGN